MGRFIGKVGYIIRIVTKTTKTSHILHNDIRVFKFLLPVQVFTRVKIDSGKAQDISLSHRGQSRVVNGREDQRHIVGGHINALFQRIAASSRRVFEFTDVADSPSRIPLFQRFMKRCVPRARVLAVQIEGSIDGQDRVVVLGSAEQTFGGRIRRDVAKVDSDE